LNLSGRTNGIFPWALFLVNKERRRGPAFGNLFVKMVPRPQGFGVPAGSLVTAERFERVVMIWEGRSQELQGQCQNRRAFGLGPL
jgi:hypothetical protein